MPNSRTMPRVTTIDTGYLDHAEMTAAYLVVDGKEAAFVETNTTHAVPRLLAALEQAGPSPEDVKFVVITHVHLDHAGGASALMKACPHAVLLAHPRAAVHAIDPSKLVTSARQVYGDEAFDTMYGSIEGIDKRRVRALGDGETFTLGNSTLSVMHTRGHANHHFCVLDPSSGGIFTGDAFGLVYPAIQDGGRWALPSTSPTDFDAAAARDSVQRIVGSGMGTAYLTHYGGFSDLSAIGGQLDEQLAAYGAIVDDAMASGVDGDALDDMCRQRVAAIFDRYLTTPQRKQAVQPGGLLTLDLDLNAQGVAFAVRKRRFKAAKG